MELSREPFYSGFPAQDVGLQPGILVGGNIRGRRLFAFEWIPTDGFSLANGFCELTVHRDDGGPLGPQDGLDLALVVATQDGGPPAPPIAPGLVTAPVQSAATIALQPGRVAYRGPAVYSLCVTRSNVCAWRVRLELWGAASPARTLELSATLCLAVGADREWRTLARMGARNPGAGVDGGDPWAPPSG